jgi:hypothetical protein
MKNKVAVVIQTGMEKYRDNKNATVFELLVNLLIDINDGLNFYSTTNNGIRITAIYFNQSYYRMYYYEE